MRPKPYDRNASRLTRETRSSTPPPSSAANTQQAAGPAELSRQAPINQPGSLPRTLHSRRGTTVNAAPRGSGFYLGSQGHQAGALQCPRDWQLGCIDAYVRLTMDYVRDGGTDPVVTRLYAFGSTLNPINSCRLERQGEMLDDPGQRSITFATCAVASSSGRRRSLVARALQADPNNVFALEICATQLLFDQDHRGAHRVGQKLFGFGHRDHAAISVLETARDGMRERCFDESTFNEWMLMCIEDYRLMQDRVATLMQQKKRDQGIALGRKVLALEGSRVEAISRFFFAKSASSRARASEYTGAVAPPADVPPRPSYCKFGAAGRADHAALLAAYFGGRQCHEQAQRAAALRLSFIGDIARELIEQQIARNALLLSSAPDAHPG